MNLRYFRKNLIPNLIVVVYVSIVIFALVISSIQAVHWSQMPFIGGFLTPSLNFIQVTKVLPNDSWPLQEHGLGTETKLVSINGLEINSTTRLINFLAAKHPGDSVTITTSIGESSHTFEVELGQFTPLDDVIYLYTSLFAALVCFVIGLWVFNNTPQTTLSIPTRIVLLQFVANIIYIFQFHHHAWLIKTTLPGYGNGGGIFDPDRRPAPKKMEAVVSKSGIKFHRLSTQPSSGSNRNLPAKEYV